MTLAFVPADDPALLPGEAEAGAFAGEIATIAATAQVPPWCSYLVLDHERAVGFGGFKGPPDAAGEVEFGYLTFAGHEGRGVATGFAEWLVATALANGARAAVAHTLPERNASTRVLEKAGFVREGWGRDDDVGQVWRWRRAL